MLANCRKNTRWIFTLIVIGLAWGVPAGAFADAVLEWNQLLLQAARSQAMPPTTASRQRRAGRCGYCDVECEIHL